MATLPKANIGMMDYQSFENFLRYLLIEDDLHIRTKEGNVVPIPTFLLNLRAKIEQPHRTNSQELSPKSTTS